MRWFERERQYHKRAYPLLWILKQRRRGSETPERYPL